VGLTVCSGSDWVNMDSGVCHGVSWCVMVCVMVCGAECV
jgi:hypothetical protein